MRRIKIIPAIIFILSLSFNAAFLIHMLTAHAAHSETMEKEIPLNLNLSEQQKKQLEPFRLKMHRENEVIRKKITQCQKELLSALKTEPVDKKAIDQCIENISQLQKEVQLNTIEEILQVKKHMNPEQCNCLINGLGSALGQAAKPCNCPHCRALKK